MSLCFEKGFILIHQYKQCGMNIVLDENSGAVHVVDDLTYDLIGRIAAGKTTSKKILSAVKKDFPKASPSIRPWSRPCACMWPMTAI